MARLRTAGRRSREDPGLRGRRLHDSDPALRVVGSEGPARAGPRRGAPGRCGMTSDKLISADSHVSEPLDLWVERVDKRYRDRAPRLVENPSEPKRVYFH